jgi:Lrp/AsnC family transcriptional regulator
MLERLDEMDRRLLRLLQEDAARPVTELAEMVGLSPSPCWRRIKRLEDAGIIKGRVVLLDAHALGLELVVFARVKLSAHGRQALPEFEREIRKYDEVMECYTVSGMMDYLIRIVTTDVRGYERFLRDHLLKMPTVHEVHSTIALTQVKYSTALPV